MNENDTNKNSCTSDDRLVYKVEMILFKTKCISHSKVLLNSAET